MTEKNSDEHPRGTWAASLHKAIFAPTVARLLRSRPTAAVLATGGLLQIIAALFHLPGMPCPVLHLFHVPCPGCGVSRGCAAILRGQWPQWLRIHAFAPMFLLAVVLFSAASLMGHEAREKLASLIERIERRSALPTLLLLAALLYWVIRLLYAPMELAHLTGG